MEIYPHFVAFPWVVTSTVPGGFMVAGTPEGSTESDFMEKFIHWQRSSTMFMCILEF